jgi:formate-dependent nitrite reductase membrane component NrfD
MNLLRRKSITTGREMNPHTAVLTGEGAQQSIRQPQPDSGSKVELWRQVPSIPGKRQLDYYRLPLVKEPVWIWSVPLYFYVGGVAGGSALLAAAAHGRRSLRRIASWCRWFAFLGTTLGPALLTWDLGKMQRFFNMLRVLRPSSPMSIGSWSLAGTGMLATLTLVQGNSDNARPAALGAAAGGLMLSGYTGVLLGNTANPLWYGTRRTLPLLFTASAMASTAGLLEMLPLNGREEKVVKRFGMVGKIGEAACMVAMEREAAVNPQAAKALHEGKGGALWQGAKAMLAAGIVLSLIPVKSPWKRRVGGAVTTAGAICLRFALLEAGKEAAREPQATIEAQREIYDREGARRSSLG